MFRTGASRLALRSTIAPISRQAGPARRRVPAPAQWITQYSSISARRPQLASMAQLRPVQAALARRPMADLADKKINKQAEDRYRHEKLEPTPETVSSSSSVHPVFSEVGIDNPVNDVDMMAGVRHDVNTIKETFSLAEVPRQAYTIGLAGVLPYLATSLSTVVCAYEINHASGGQGYLMSANTAEALLHVLEPLQIGYGAVILSFLGAIHWGLEWAGYGGYQGYPRYAIGVVAPAVAWPTVLLPVEYALISQFCAFTLLYYVDTRASYRGWTPPWYAIYRFVLTFIVGASIVVTLIGRGEVADRVGRLPGAVDRVTALRESAQEKMAQEEEGIRIQNAAKEAQSSEDGEGKDST